MAQKEDERNYMDYDELEQTESHLMLGIDDRRGRRKYPSHRRQLWLRSLIVLAVLLAMAANAGVWILVAKRPRDALDEEWNHCGRSSTDAINLGCVMEPLFYGWMPPQCVYQELTDRYPVFEDRKWYLEQELINEVPSKSLWEGENIKVYTHIYHGEHCLFQWRKVMFAMDRKEPYIDNKTISLHHSSHCADQLTIDHEGEHAVNEVEIGFYQCRNTLWAS